MQILDKLLLLLGIQKLAAQKIKGTRLLRDDYGVRKGGLSFGQIISMRKKNNRGKIIKRLKGTLGKRYHGYK